VYCHRICYRLHLLRLCLVATIIPLANAWRQVVVVDFVDIIDVVVIRRRAVAVVAIIIIIVCHAIDVAVAIVVRRTVAVAIFVDVVVCCAVTIVIVIVLRDVTLIVDAIVHRTPTEKEAKTSSLLVFLITKVTFLCGGTSGTPNLAT
jgi:hypothetical protein